MSEQAALSYVGRFILSVIGVLAGAALLGFEQFAVGGVLIVVGLAGAIYYGR